MYLTADAPPINHKQRSAEVKRIGMQYWQQLRQVGVPALPAGKIAAAIAKFDIARRRPTLEQKQLITRYSPLICRAQLWRRDLLLPYLPQKSQRIC
ncbi:MAG TPA: hypothetical protein V6D29_04275 [Leptolyngbyaceae cyanobacterium]